MNKFIAAQAHPENPARLCLSKPLPTVQVHRKSGSMSFRLGAPALAPFTLTEETDVSF